MTVSETNLDSAPAPLTLRHTVGPADRDHVRALTESVRIFDRADLEVALELVDEHLSKGAAASGYYYVFAEQAGSVVGYACYGPIPMTVARFDLYWIAVEKSQQGRGLGRKLLSEVERLVRDAGGKRLYLETSGVAKYQPTRAFYERCGYEVAAVLHDFYDDGDDEVVFLKVL